MANNIDKNRKSINLLDESIDDFQENFKLIKENKLKLANISKFLVPKSLTISNNNDDDDTSIETNKISSSKSNELNQAKQSNKVKKIKPALSKLNNTNNFKSKTSSSNSNNNDTKISKYFVNNDTQLNTSENSSNVKTEAPVNTFKCPICNDDLTIDAENDRQLHVNKCIDKFSKQKQTEPVISIVQANVVKDEPVISDSKAVIVEAAKTTTTTEPKQDNKFVENVLKEGIPNCPICGKVCHSQNSRQTHLKKCANIFHIKPESLVELVKKQHDRILKDLNNGFIPNDVYIPKPKSTDNNPKKPKQPSRIMKLEQPQCEQDEEIQMAIALSKSLCKNEDHKYQMQIQKFVDKKSGKKGGKIHQDVEPVLLMTDDEDRRRLISQRLSSIMLNQLDLTVIKHTNCLKKSKFNTQTNYLWDKCKYFTENSNLFYVNIFLQNANFHVGGQLFVQKENEAKFNDITVINTQTAFLLADLNNTTQVNQTQNLTINYDNLTQFPVLPEISEDNQLAEIEKDNQVVEIDENNRITEDPVETENIQSDEKLDVIIDSGEDKIEQNQEFEPEIVSEDTIEETILIEHETDSVEKSITNFEKAQVIVDDTLCDSDSESEKNAKHEDTALDETLVQHYNNSFNKTIEQEIVVTENQDGNIAKMSDDIILIQSDNSNDKPNETAFLVDDSNSSNVIESIIIESSLSSSLSFCLPQINDDKPVFDEIQQLYNTEECQNSFQTKYGKRKSVSLDNIYLTENENKIIKLDDSFERDNDNNNDCLITPELNNILNKSMGFCEDNQKQATNEAPDEVMYDEIWDNFNENQYDYVYNCDSNDRNEIIVNETIMNESKNNQDAIEMHKSDDELPSINFGINDSYKAVMTHSIVQSPKKLNEAKPANDDVISNKIECFKTPKINNLIKESRIVSAVVDSPLTPMPGYLNMNTPNLKDELKKFGVKALPRKQAIKKLVEIYEYTHRSKLTRRSKSCTDLRINADAMITVASVVTDTNNEEQSTSTTKSIFKPKAKTKLKKTVSNIECIKEPAKAKRQSVKNMNDFSLFEVDNDQVVTASQQITSTQSTQSSKIPTLSEEELTIKIHDIIINDNELYNQILNYEPLDFESFTQKLKNLAQFKVNSKLIMKILDEYCVTFTLKNIRTRVSKVRSRKKH